MHNTLWELLHCSNSVLLPNSDFRSNTVVKCFPLQIVMSGNCSSLFTAAVSKKDKGKNRAKVGKQKNKGE